MLGLPERDRIEDYAAGDAGRLPARRREGYGVVVDYVAGFALLVDRDRQLDGERFANVHLRIRGLVLAERG